MQLPDYTVLIQIAIFLILLFLLNVILYRPIRRIIYKRKEKITADENLAEDWNKKAGEFTKELEDNLSTTRKEGIKEKEELKNKGIQDEKEMLTEAYDSAEDRIENARAEINEKFLNARQSLQSEVDDFSHALAEKILGRGI